MIYQFEGAELDTDTFELRAGGSRVAVEPQVFEVLSYLLEHRDRLVPRPELLDAVWGDRFVSDSALSSRIKAARSAIGDDGRHQRLIRTIHGRGLQFVGDVMTVESSVVQQPAVAVSDLKQRVRFATGADGSELAVATVGNGYPLVKAANWLTHVELDWHSPVWHHWMHELGSRFNFVRYDARGCGLSTHDLSASDLTDLDTWTTDLEAVVDGQGLEKFALFGMSQGGGPAMNYAVRHPDRVSHLVLLGCYSRGMNQRSDEAAAQASVYVDLMRVGWGGTNPAFRSFFTTSFLPEASSEHIRWFNELQSQTTSTENALQLEAAFYDQDFSELAAQISVPTMVFHCRDDMAAPFDEGRRLASLIPDAEFVTLDSANHILMPDEPAWATFLDELTAFIAPPAP